MDVIKIRFVVDLLVIRTKYRQYNDSSFIYFIQRSIIPELYCLFCTFNVIYNQKQVKENWAFPM